MHHFNSRFALTLCVALQLVARESQSTENTPPGTTPNVRNNLAGIYRPRSIAVFDVGKLKTFRYRASFRFRSYPKAAHNPNPGNVRVNQVVAHLPEAILVAAMNAARDKSLETPSSQVWLRNEFRNLFVSGLALQFTGSPQVGQKADVDFSLETEIDDRLPERFGSLTATFNSGFVRGTATIMHKDTVLRRRSEPSAQIPTEKAQRTQFGREWLQMFYQPEAVLTRRIDGTGNVKRFVAISDPRLPSDRYLITPAVLPIDVLHDVVLEGAYATKVEAMPQPRHALSNIELNPMTRAPITRLLIQRVPTPPEQPLALTFDHSDVGDVKFEGPVARGELSYGGNTF